jgi:ankyrin repeat protein
LEATAHPTAEQIQAFVLAAHGNFEKVQALYDEDPALLNEKFERFDENALEAAGHTGRRDIAEFLLSKGAPPTVFSAAMLGDLAAVEGFLAAEPGLAVRPGVHGISLLFHAALSGNVELAEFVVAAGAAPDDQALHAAARFDRLDVTRWLLARGVADVNVKNFEGKTPVQVAEERGFAAVAGILREHGGN